MSFLILNTQVLKGPFFKKLERQFGLVVKEPDRNQETEF